MTIDENGNGRYQRDDTRLLIALASGLTIRKAAKVAEVSVATVMRRMEEESFRQELAKVRARMIDQAIGRLSKSMAAASTTLHKLLNANSEMCRLAAARSILELGTKLRESVELEERLAELERQFGGTGR
jgi:hypothetical protein